MGDTQAADVEAHSPRECRECGGMLALYNARERNVEDCLNDRPQNGDNLAATWSTNHNIPREMAYVDAILRFGLSLGSLDMPPWLLWLLLVVGKIPRLKMLWLEMIGQ